jgi:hypothetical protein
MAVHAEASDSTVAATEFRATLDALGIAQQRAARLFGVGPRSVRRWQDGDRRVPRGVDIVIHLLAAGTVTIAQVEAAVAIPARTNGSAKLGAPAPLLVAPAPEQSVVAGAEAAAPAGPGLSTAEKVCALSADVCRWPCGDPACPDFHFCSSPVARKPYCEHHRAMAYAPPLTGSGPGARTGPVSRGWRSPTPGPRTTLKTANLDVEARAEARARVMARARAFGFHDYTPSEETIAIFIGRTAPVAVEPGKQRRGPGPGQPASK